MIKKIFLLILSLIPVFLLFSFPVSASENVTVCITQDGGETVKTVSFPDMKPVIVNDRTLIPVRGLFEQLGYSVEWDDANSRAVVKNFDTIVHIPIDCNYLVVNGVKQSTDVGAQLINSRTMIPLRVVSEAFGLNVEWNEKTNTVTVYGEYDGRFGSAGYIGDKTIIVSIFASDTDTSWDFTNNKDNETATKTLERLSSATKWLSEQAEKYNENAEFVYDWTKNDDLVYSVKFHHPLVTMKGTYYHKQTDYIKDFIDSDKLLEKYDADNILYMFFINTPYTNSCNPWTIAKTNSDNWNVEIVNIFNCYDNVYEADATTYAHEIMHCFGAHDLYYANNYITQDYVDYCQVSDTKDIMYTVYNSDTIQNNFSELDAYYMGLTDSCSDVEKWNLKESDYLTYQP